LRRCGALCGLRSDDGQGQAGEEEPPTVIRLSGDSAGQPIRPQAPHERGFDIAAQLRPPHDGPAYRE
jgi:hypothetical protein